MNMKLTKKQNSSPKPPPRKKLILSAALLIILLASAVLWLCLHRSADSAEPSPSPSSFDTSVEGNVTAGGNTSEGKEDIQDALNKQVADGMINISMNTQPVFETGESAGNLLIVNDKSNKHMQIVEIYQDDIGTLIYRSGGIPIGGQIDSARLDTTLPKGVYPCTAYFNAVQEDTGALLGKAGAKIEITVQK
jgi:hypothetical protein